MTVLVVDDEQQIVRMVANVLAELDLHAETAGDGAEGLEQFRKHADEIALVLTDIMMPEMNGLDMAHRILEIRPDTKILFMSGYSDGALENRARKEFPFLRKPFLASALMRKVGEMLGIARV